MHKEMTASFTDSDVPLILTIPGEIGAGRMMSSLNRRTAAKVEQEEKDNRNKRDPKPLGRVGRRTKAASKPCVLAL